MFFEHLEVHLAYWDTTKVQILTSSNGQAEVIKTCLVDIILLNAVWVFLVSSAEGFPIFTLWSNRKTDRIKTNKCFTETNKNILFSYSF